MNNSGDSRNVIIAVILSAVVLFGWQFFVAGPQMERAQRASQIAAEQAAQQQVGNAVPTPDSATVSTGATPGATPGIATADNQVFPDRAAAIAASARVKIDTPALAGSIALTGARLDDLELKRYTETIDPKSPIITLLSPISAQGAYFVEQGWVTAGAAAKLPDAKSVWTLDAGSQILTATTPVTLSWDNGEGLVFHRKFEVDDNYLFTVTQSVENKTAADVTLFPYARVARYGLPHVQNFFILHEGPVGVLGDANLVSRKYSDMHNDKQVDVKSNGGWLGFVDKYWATAVLSEPKEPISSRFAWRQANGQDIFETNFVADAPVTVAAGASAQDKSYVFAGAKVESVIGSYEQKYGFDRLELLIDWGWFHFITKPMFWLLKTLYGLIGNFGLAILAVTVIVKLLFFPLANRSYASMAAMRRVQPEMKSIQERFKDDRTAQQQAMMELYKREKINPLAGCWPVLVQIPVFFSLYTVLFITIEMRHAPFFGWVQDLAAPDPTNIFTLFGLIPWDPTALPFIGHFLALGFWPLVMGVTMWVQMRLNPPPADPTQAMIFNWMPVIFTFMLGTFPAGLVIYWAWNNFLSICQQWFIMKRHGAEVDLFGNILASFRRKPKPAAETKS